MFNYCAHISATEDNNIQRQMGNMSIEEFVDHMIMSAQSPKELDALAFQIQCVQNRIKYKDIRKKWKAQNLRVIDLYGQAVNRLKNIPTEETHRHLFNDKFVNRPGLLDGDLRLPIYARVDFSDWPWPNKEVFTGTYSSPLIEDEIYKIGLGRLNEIGITFVGSGYTTMMKIHSLRKLWQLGRLVAVEKPD